MRKTSDIIWQDAQHQVLFDILDIIKQPGAGRQVLEQMRDYTDTHFTLEELYMETLDYPGREAHLREHNRFRKEIDHALGTDGEPNAQFMALAGTFLTEWLARHVFGIDKDLEAFLLDKGIH